MKKLFIMTGELSGDKIGAWYLKQLLATHACERVEAIGGDFLAAAGATLYDRIERYALVGVIEILWHLPFIFRQLKNITRYIITEKFDTVVLVDFPGFNLRLLTRLKAANPALNVIYVSPPQLWAWRAQRVEIIKALCNDVIVLYPFEVAWYAERGVKATYLGSPVAQAMQPYRELSRHKEPMIAFIPGSRMGEIKRLLPVMIEVIRQFKRSHKTVKIVMPVAESIPLSLIEHELKRAGLQNWGNDLELIHNNDEKYRALARCCYAVTKSGTTTLELALLNVPSIVIYKVHGLTYWIARMLVTVKYTALPNIFLGTEVFPEFIQARCRADVIAAELAKGYESYARQEPVYAEKKALLATLGQQYYTSG